MILIDRLIVICDICGRFYVASLILYYAFAAGVSQVFFENTKISGMMR